MELKNETVSRYRGIVKGRMGIPFDDEDVAVIALTLRGDINDINSGKLTINLPMTGYILRGPKKLCRMGGRDFFV
jgi:hypothetical protein